jgi:hypothetical protein
MLEVVDRQQVIVRIEDWISRIEGLYREIREFYERLPEVHSKQILEGSVLQASEEMMEQFDVPPRMIPTLAVLYGKNRVSFVPHGLWIIGSNGRVNITTNRHQYILVDQSEYGSQAREWRIVTSRLAKIRRDFDFDVFRALAEGWEIE